MASHGTGSWFPPEDGHSCWLVNENYQWVELSGPGLVRKGQLVPLEKKNGVYVLKMKFGQRAEEPTMLAPVQALTDEDSLEDVLHQALQEQVYDNHLQPYDPDDFEDAAPDNMEVEENIAAEQQQPMQVHHPPTPYTPTIAEREAHLLTAHAEFVPWCGDCVAGQGRDRAHYRQTTDPGIPIFFVDYGF